MQIRHVALWAMAAIPVCGESLSLPDAEREALSANPQAMASRLAALASERGADTGPYYMPRVDALVAASKAPPLTRIGTPPGGINNPIIISHFAAGVQVTMPVTDFGRTSLTNESNKRRAEALKQRSDVTTAQILLAVRTAYFDLWKAQELESLAAKGQGAELEKILAQNNRLIAAVELATLLGRRPETSLRASDPPDASRETYNVEELVAKALANHPGIEASRLEATAAAKAATAERRAMLPSISFVGSAGIVPAAARAYPGDTYLAAGLLLSMPVLPWKPAAARRNETELRSEVARANVEDAENRLRRDVLATVLRINTASAALALARRDLDDAKTPPAQALAAGRVISAEHNMAVLKAALAFHAGDRGPE